MNLNFNEWLKSLERELAKMQALPLKGESSKWESQG